MLGADKHALPTLKTFHALCLCLVKSHKQLLGIFSFSFYSSFSLLMIYLLSFFFFLFSFFYFYPLSLSLSSGLSENMTIYDQVKQKQIIKKCMTEWESTHGKAALFSQQKPEFETIMGI